VAIGMQLSGTGRKQPNQAKIEARHHINKLLAANQTLQSHASGALLQFSPIAGTLTDKFLPACATAPTRFWGVFG